MFRLCAPLWLAPWLRWRAPPVHAPPPVSPALPGGAVSVRRRPKPFWRGRGERWRRRGGCWAAGEGQEEESARLCRRRPEQMAVSGARTLHFSPRQVENPRPDLHARYSPSPCMPGKTIRWRVAPSNGSGWRLFPPNRPTLHPSPPTHLPQQRAPNRHCTPPATASQKQMGGGGRREVSSFAVEAWDGWGRVAAPLPTLYMGSGIPCTFGIVPTPGMPQVDRLPQRGARNRLVSPHPALISPAWPAPPSPSLPFAPTPTPSDFVPAVPAALPSCVP